MVHMRFGGEYIDKNPITGRPGEFHLSSTGRKAVPPPHADPKNANGGLGAMNGPPAINTKLDDIGTLGFGEVHLVKHFRNCFGYKRSTDEATIGSHKEEQIHRQ